MRRRKNLHGAVAPISTAGFTLTEVVISLLVSAIATAGILSGYVFTARSAEWSAHSLAANSLAIQRMEQTRAAKWDLQASPQVDNMQQTNFPPQVEVLDVPISGTNFVYATNFTTISNVSTNPPLRMVRVDCVWSFVNGRIFTNSITTYRSPDQ
jgi:prepilin-type N-terminal cleavage/methylation domain-containing protein